MSDPIRVSRITFALGLGIALAACSGMNKPMSKSSFVATKANMQAQIVPIDPSTIDEGPTPTRAERAAVARGAYDSGQVSESVSESKGATSGGS